MTTNHVIRLLADRTAVLFLGVGAGAAIGYAFAGDIAQVIRPSPTADSTAEQTSSGAKPVTSPPLVASTATIKPVATARAIECAMPFQPRLLQAVADGGKIRVGVFGDSYGDGLWAALYHQLPARDKFEVLKFSQQSTGFTRYASLNLEDHVTEQLSGQTIDVAVISFGANDTQGVMHNGHYAALLSPAWKEEIGARVERYINILRAHGAIVYWVGLPIMRKPTFDTDISGMNAFYAETMAKLDIPFIDTRPMSVDENGAYSAYLPDPVSHVPRLMRANDGIHMSMGGYQRLTSGLAERIRRYIGEAHRKAEQQGLAKAAGTNDPDEQRNTGA